MEPKIKQAVIVFFDLEMIPNMVEAMKVWPQLSNYPGLTLRATVSTIICAGWKYYGHKKVECINAWDWPKKWKNNINNDFEVVKAIYDVLKHADAVVTHNGKRFDWKFLQTRLMYHGLGPLGNIHHIDTKQTASRHLYSFNNRLGYLGEWLANDKKLDHEGWDLWVDVSNDCEKAKKKMTAYCKQDVLLLEKVFERLKPLISNIPNYNIFIPGRHHKCPNCGSIKVSNNGWRHTKTRSYKRYICRDCKTWFRTDAKDNMPRPL